MVSAFSLPLFFTGLFGYFIGWSDNLVIGKLLTADKLGVYAVAYSLAHMLTFVVQSFSGIFVPLITEARVKNSSSEVTFLFKKSAAWIFGLTFPVYLVLIAFSSFILNFLYGEQYVSGSTSLAILSTGMMVSVSLGLSSSVLILHKKTFFTFIVNMSVALFNILLTIFLVPHWGIKGAAISSSISLILISFAFVIKAGYYEKIFFDLKYYLKFIFSGIISILIATRIDFSSSELFTVILSGVIYLILYLILLILLKTFKSDDKEIFQAIAVKLGLRHSVIIKLIKAL